MPDAVQLLDDENPCGLFYNVALVLTILFLPVLGSLLPILYVRAPTKIAVLILTWPSSGVVVHL